MNNSATTPNAITSPTIDKRSWVTLFTMTLIILMINIDFTAVNLIISPITKSLHIPVEDSQWIITVYMLVFTVLLVTAGRLGDIFGHRKIIIIGTSLFAIASFATGFAHTESTIILSRLLQGIGGALVVPSSTIIALHSFPKEKSGMVMGVINVGAGLSLAIGPPLGGYLTHILSWRWVFLINVPISMIVIAACCCLVREINNHENEKKKLALDVYGLITLGIFLTTLLCTIDLLKRAQQNLISIALLCVIAIIAAYTLYKVENKTSNPILDLSILKNKAFIGWSCIRTTLQFSFCSMLFIIGLYLQHVFALSTLHASLVFIPLTIAIIVLSFAAGKIADNFNPVIIAGISIALYSAIYLLLSIVDVQQNLHKLTLLLTMIGVSFGATSTAIATLALKNISKEKAGVAAALFYMLGTMGGSTGITIASVIMGQYAASGQDPILFGMPKIMLAGFIVTFIALLGIIRAKGGHWQMRTP